MLAQPSGQSSNISGAIRAALSNSYQNTVNMGPRTTAAVAALCGLSYAALINSAVWGAGVDIALGVIGLNLFLLNIDSMKKLAFMLAAGGSAAVLAVPFKWLIQSLSDGDVDPEIYRMAVSGFAAAAFFYWLPSELKRKADLYFPHYLVNRLIWPMAIGSAGLINFLISLNPDSYFDSAAEVIHNNLNYFYFLIGLAVSEIIRFIFVDTEASMDDECDCSGLGGGFGFLLSLISKFYSSALILGTNTATDVRGKLDLLTRFVSIPSDTVNVICLWLAALSTARPYLPREFTLPDLYLMAKIENTIGCEEIVSYRENLVGALLTMPLYYGIVRPCEQLQRKFCAITNLQTERLSPPEQCKLMAKILYAIGKELLEVVSPCNFIYYLASHVLGSNDAAEQMPFNLMVIAGVLALIGASNIFFTDQTDWKKLHCLTQNISHLNLFVNTLSPLMAISAFAWTAYNNNPGQNPEVMRSFLIGLSVSLAITLFAYCRHMEHFVSTEFAKYNLSIGPDSVNPYADPLNPKERKALNRIGDRIQSCLTFAKSRSNSIHAGAVELVTSPACLAALQEAPGIR